MLTAQNTIHDRFHITGRDVLTVTCRRCYWSATVTRKGLLGALLHDCRISQAS